LPDLASPWAWYFDILTFSDDCHFSEEYFIGRLTNTQCHHAFDDNTTIKLIQISLGQILLLPIILFWYYISSSIIFIQSLLILKYSISATPL
jgi:hypothetical protein